jgi:hypothetical protein
MVIFSRKEGGDIYEVSVAVKLKIPFFWDTKLRLALSDLEFSKEGSAYVFKILYIPGLTDSWIENEGSSFLRIIGNRLPIEVKLYHRRRKSSLLLCI